MLIWSALLAVPAFGLDTFAVATGLGGIAGADRNRLILVTVVFEGGMPLLGAAVGAVIGHIASRYALWGGCVLLVVLGVRAMAEGLAELRDDDQASPRTPRPMRGWGLIAAGLSVSADELAAGLAVGAAGVPLAVLAPALALQAGVFTLAGLRAAVALRALAGRYGEIAAGAALCLIAVWLWLVGTGL